MIPFPQTPSKGPRSPPSFTSNVSPPPPRYQSISRSTHSSAQGRQLGTSLPDNVGDISLGSEAALPGPRYVYYRIYSPTSGVEIKNPEFPEDPYLGCSLAIRIPPPHIADSVKCHICWREDISDHKNTKLFTDISCLSTPLDDYEPVHILDHSGVGSTTGDPVALVILEPGSTGYQYKLKANLDLTSVDTRNPGWLLYRKGDILHTNGVPIKDPHLGTHDGFRATNDTTQVSGFIALKYRTSDTYLEFVGPSPTLPRGFKP